MLQTSKNQNVLPLIMHFAKTAKPKNFNAEYVYNDVTQKPEYRLDYSYSVKTKVEGGWTWDQKTSKTPPKTKKK